MTTDILTAFRLSLIGKSPHTVRLYGAAVRTFLRSLPAPDMAHVTLETVRAYIEGVATHATAPTVSVHLTAMRSFCRWAQREAGLDPAVLNNMPRSWKVPHTVPTTATVEEIEALIQATEKRPRHRAIVCLAAHAGLRSSEIRNLKWNDVDLPKASLNILGKGRKLRQVPILSIQLYEALRALPKTEELVLPGRGGLAMKSDTLVHMIHQACGWAGVARLPSSTDRVCHALRHGFAAKLASKAVSVAHIQYLLGHSSLVLTEQYLTSLRGPEPARVAVAAAGVFA